MSPSRRNILTTVAIVLGGPLLVALIGWAAVRADQSKLDTSRFVTDSIRRAVRDSSRDATLQRIDSRVGEMYCSSVPTLNRGGCR